MTEKYTTYSFEWIAAGILKIIFAWITIGAYLWYGILGTAFMKK